MKKYLDLVSHVLETGTRKENRTGVDTLSTFNYNYEHDLSEGFPLLTTKQVNFKNIVIELLWFLTGSNQKDFLERHKCGFWRPWYNEDGSVNAAYGPAWRKFEYPKQLPTGAHDLDHNDQIKWVVEKLKAKPMSRDLVVSAWQPHIAQKPPTTNAYWAPCHCMFIFNVQVVNGAKRLCLHLTQRSCDCALGVPYNLASYALLCHLVSRFAGLDSGIFGHSLVDAHVYTSKPDGSMPEYDHVPGLKEQLLRKPLALPRLSISDQIQSLEDVERLLDPSVSTEAIMQLFVLEGYNPYPAIPFKVAV